MYLVYLRQANGMIVGGVEHAATREQAEHCFARLVNETAYDGFDLLAVLVENRRPIAIHRFNQPPGTAQSWRERLDELPFTPLH